MNRMKQHTKRSASPASDSSRQKRLNIAESDDDEVVVRLMIPASVAGAIIGKKGETLKQIKNEVGCNIKMSRNEDGMYPTTMERVLNARGRVSSVCKLMSIIINKIIDKLDQNHAPDQFDHKNTPRSHEMKFIVPNTSAGMVIGKSGASIKEIREKTGVSVQVFPKAGTMEAQRSAERIITIASSNPPDLETACMEVCKRISGDPQHDQGPEFFNPAMTANGIPGGLGGGGGGPMGPPGQGPPGYGPPGGRGGPMDGPFGGGPPGFGGPGGPMGGGQGPPPMFGGAGGGPNQQGHPGGQVPPGMPPGMGGQQQGRFDGGGNLDVSRPPVSMFGGGGGGQNQAPPNQQPPSGLMQPGFKFNPMEGVANSEVLQFLDSLQMTLRSSGFNEQAVSEIMTSMQVLAKYNIMGLGLGLGVAAMATLRGSGAVPPNSSAGLTMPTSTTPVPSQQPPPSHADTSLLGSGAAATATAGGVPSADNAAFALAPTSQQPPTNMTELGGYGNQSASSAGGPTPLVGGVPQSPQQQQQQQQQQQNAAAQQQQQNNFAASVIKTRMQVEPGKLELEIPAPIVTAVLPQGGKTLENIQRFSGTNIDASKRASDPTFRLVTVQGDPDAVRAAKVMIERSINEEQARRQRMSAF